MDRNPHEERRFRMRRLNEDLDAALRSRSKPEKPIYTFEPLRSGFRYFGEPITRRTASGRLHIHYPRQGPVFELQGPDIQGTTVGNMTTYPTMEERPSTNILWGYSEQDERVRDQIGTYVVDLTSRSRVNDRPFMNSFPQYANAEDEAVGDLGPVSRNASQPIITELFNTEDARELFGFAGRNVSGRSSPWDRATVSFNAMRNHFLFIPPMPAEAREAYFEQTKEAKVRKRERMRRNEARFAELVDEQDIEED